MAIDKILTARDVLQYGGGKVSSRTSPFEAAPTGVQKAQEETTVNLLKRSSQAVGISEIGRQIGELYRTLQRDDAIAPSDKSAALEGLRKTVESFATSPRNEELMNVVMTAKQLAREQSGENLQKAFAMASEVEKTGASLRTWWDAFSGLQDTSLRSAFLEGSQSIARAAGTAQERAETLTTFMETVNNLSKGSPSSPPSNTQLPVFLEGVSNAPSLEEQRAFMVTFGEQTFTNQQLL